MSLNPKLDLLLQQRPYGLSAEEKRSVFLPAVQEALQYHYEHCELYRRWADKRRFDVRKPLGDAVSVPFLPVSIFKRLALSSVPETEVVRVLASSATTSQVPSRVALDQETRNRQMRVLAQLLSEVLGPARRPFIVLDCPPQAGPGAGELSARIAGLRGYLLAASQTHYVMTNNQGRPELDLPRFRSVLAELAASRTPFCLLGYTYIFYQYVLRPLREAGLRWELPDDTVAIHFGGWKKLAGQAVSKAVLNETAREVFGLPAGAVRDIYGFTEQLGVIYPDGPDGFKRVPVYSEVIVRDPRTLEPLPDGEAGLLEFITPLPHSYPGTALLLDDWGRKIPAREAGAESGAAFEVLGRIKNAEVRGCGDTLPARVYEVR